jgi:site-specific recombinase XerD
MSEPPSPRITDALPEQNGQISVRGGPCPVTGRVTYALYDGDSPIVPATVYLRHLANNEGLAANTVHTYAFRLKAFFAFLRGRGVLFWKMTPGAVKKFKHLQIRRAAAEPDSAIMYQTAQQYVVAVKGLVQYWRGLRDADPFFLDRAAEMDGVRRRRRGRGELLHAAWFTRVPDSTWRVRIPASAKHDKNRYKGLSREQSGRVMEVLNRRKHETPTETLLYYRDRAIWAYSLMACLRKGELVRSRLEDANVNTGVVTIKDRPEDRWLGDLKSGPGEVYVTPRNPYWTYLDSWLLYGRPIAEDMLAEWGQEDHGLLFCNQDGGPLTQAAVEHLFGRLKEECGFGEGTPFHHHVARHTMATLLLESGVELEQVQKYLRHRSRQSTEIYAVVTTGALRRTMDHFWSTYKVG